MNNPCEWCKSTSEQIDSLEHEIESYKRSVFELMVKLEAKDKRLKHAEDTLKRVYQSYLNLTPVRPVTMAQDYLDTYNLIDF